MLFITNDTDATLTLQTQSYYGNVVSDVITVPPGEQVGELQTRAGRQYFFVEARLSDPPLEVRGPDRFFHGGQEYFITIDPSYFGRAHVSDAIPSEAPSPQPASAANWCARIPGTWDWFIGTVDFTGTGDANRAHGTFTSGDDLHGPSPRAAPSLGLSAQAPTGFRPNGLDSAHSFLHLASTSL